MNILFKFVTLLFAILFAATAAAATRPNIIFIMVDDLDVAVWNTALNHTDANGKYILPNIRKLIDKGTTFNQVFASQPLCCPSRATFFTGQYPHNHGVTNNPDDVNKFYNHFRDTLEPSALGVWLQQPHRLDGTSYRTGYFGKYMNGSGKKELHLPQGWNVWRALLPKTVVQCMYGYTLSNTGKPPQLPFGDNANPDEKNYQTNKLASLAADFIKDPASAPFFVVVTPTAPHTEACMQGQTSTGVPNHEIRTSPKYAGQTPLIQKTLAELFPAFNEDEMGDKPLWMQGLEKLTPEHEAEFKQLFDQKIAALRPIDDMVGKLQRAVDDANKSDNTIIIFTSDNGFQYGTHRLTGKNDFYEESARLPMVVKMPGQDTKYVQESWILNNDWAPTIAKLADVNPMLPVDGRSFHDLILDPAKTNGRRTLLMRAGGNPPVTTLAKKPARTKKSNGTVSGTQDASVDDDEGSLYPYLAVRTRDPELTGDNLGKKTVVYAETYDALGNVIGEELYVMSPDSPESQYQMKSALDEQEWQDRKPALRRKLRNMMDCSGPQCRKLEGQ